MNSQDFSSFQSPTLGTEFEEDEKEEEEIIEQPIPPSFQLPISETPQSSVYNKKTSMKNKRDSIDRMMFNFLKSNEEKRGNEENQDKDNLDFFKSLTPLCRGWNNRKKIKFRSDVLNLIEKYNEDTSL